MLTRRLRLLESSESPSRKLAWIVV